MIQFITSLSVRWLTWQLRKDKNFWRSYQSNIAVCIQDEYAKYFDKDTAPRNILPQCYVHQFSNNCADRFMKLWTRKI